MILLDSSLPSFSTHYFEREREREPKPNKTNEERSTTHAHTHTELNTTNGVVLNLNMLRRLVVVI